MEDMISEREVRVSEGHSGVCYVCIYMFVVIQLYPLYSMYMQTPALTLPPYL